MAVTLTWKKANWPDKTYHAAAGDLSYTVDWIGNEWNLRGWINGQFSVNEYGPTMKAMKQAATDHATGYNA